MEDETEEERDARFAELRGTLVDLPDPDPADPVGDDPVTEPAAIRHDLSNVSDLRRGSVKIIPLEYPLVLNGVRVSRISLRPPRYAHVLDVLSGAMLRTELFAEMAGVEEAVILALRWPYAAEVIRKCHELAPDLTGI